MSPKGKATAALAASLVFLLVSSISAYFAFSRQADNRAWVLHTRDVQSGLAQVTATATRAGRLRTEFVDSGDLSLLSRYADAVLKLRTTLASIRGLTADNEGQRANYERLEQLNERRIALMDRSIDLKRNGQLTAEEKGSLSREILESADEMDLLLQQMYASEDELLNERQERVRISSETSNAILIASLFLTLLLFLMHNRLLTSEVRARSEAEMAHRALSARILHVQDQERRRFARELHDSVGQNLAALRIALSLLEAKFPEEKGLQDCVSLLDQSMAETRTISYLMHPPMLDEAGLISAVRWFLEGFGKRSEMQMDLQIDEGQQRIPGAVELVLFRVLQESLTNIHRHARATKTEIKLSTVGNEAVLRVKDNGRGIPSELLETLGETGAGGGVGLMGMRERVREIGGRLEITSSAAGTEISAVVPVQSGVSRQPVVPLAIQEIA